MSSDGELYRVELGGRAWAFLLYELAVAGRSWPAWAWYEQLSYTARRED